MPTNQDDFSSMEPNTEKLKEQLKATVAPKLTGTAPAETPGITPEALKRHRRKIDFLMQQHNKITGNRELSLAFTSLQRGFMWLGKGLGDLHEANPYPESTNPKSAVIEERTDQAKDEPAMFAAIDASNRTAFVKQMRAELDAVISSVHNPAMIRSIILAKDALQEAKMWYGWELNNIRISQQGS